MTLFKLFDTSLKKLKNYYQFSYNRNVKFIFLNLIVRILFETY